MIRKSDVGQLGTFHGFDGKLYRGYVERMGKHSIAVVKYYVFQGLRMEPVTAYLVPEQHHHFVVGENHLC